MSENVETIFSPSRKYKATISEKPNFDLIEIYELSEDVDVDNGVSHGEYWSRKNIQPILVEKGFSARAFAISKLRDLMGEPDFPLSIEWIRDFSFCDQAIFINTEDVKVFSEWIDSKTNEIKTDKIETKTIIDFMGLCLVEEIGCEGEWQMGQYGNNGYITCWGNYGSLKEAIIAL